MKGFYVFLVILAFMVGGCGSNALEWAADKNSDEAKLEEARMALDKGDYERARLILEGMNTTNSEVAKYLSNAYAGKAGLDTFKLLDTIDKLTKANQTGSIDMVGKVFGGDDATLSRDEIKTKISDLTKAIDALKNAPQTDEKEVQLGLLSMNRTVMLIAEIISESNNNADVTLTEEGITSETIKNITVQENDPRLTTITTDIVNVANSATVISSMTGTTKGENDLSKNFDKFKTEVDENKNGTITNTELEKYIKSL